MGDRPSLFLSYSRADRRFAEDLERELQGQGYHVWRDVARTQAGDLIGSSISRALAEASAFCILLSKASCASRWVQLELNAALARYATDPAFRLVPVLLEREALPAVLSGLLHLSAEDHSLEELAGRVARALTAGRGSASKAVDWPALLDAIEADRFADNPAAPEFGGWSRAYAEHYVPLAFGTGRRPGSVSECDSVTVTHWAVRGLTSMARLFGQDAEHRGLLPRIERLLADARGYLLRHFDGQGAGLIRITTQGLTVLKDPRHSATFAKAMLSLPHEDPEPAARAIQYALEAFDAGDQRLPTCAEVLHVAGLFLRRPDLRPPSLSEDLLSDTVTKLAGRLLVPTRDLPRETVKYFNPGSGHLGFYRGWSTRRLRQDAVARLFVQQGQGHLSAYYSWWVLDACGDLLLASEDPRHRQLAADVLDGLVSLGIELEDDRLGYPLTLSGHADPGASAQIAELALRLDRRSYRDDGMKALAWLRSALTARFLDEYPHTYLLWAVPNLFERASSAPGEQA